MRLATAPLFCSTYLVSKLKTPHQKKKASYAKDRRNVYGENDKASRKNLPRKKARLNRAFRHEVHAALHVDGTPVETLNTDAVDVDATSVRRKKFKKQPDVPLLQYIERQRADRTRRAGSRVARKARKATKTRP
jgi:hypothetical protein